MLYFYIEPDEASYNVCVNQLTKELKEFTKDMENLMDKDDYRYSHNWAIINPDEGEFEKFIYDRGYRYEFEKYYKCEKDLLTFLEELGYIEDKKVYTDYYSDK